jgi:photosystem II stability/assembly factor-like uncharacterized protein
VIPSVALLVGTELGLVPIAEPPGEKLEALARAAPKESLGHLVRDGSGWWAIAGGRSIIRSSGGDRWEEVAVATVLDARCLLPHPSGLLVGTSEAHLLRLRDGSLDPVPSFEEAKGREDWYTPWGGPPDVRSMSVGGDGSIFVNVHVGGVLRSEDGGETWEPTMDIDVDVHQVLVHPARPAVVYAASARGLGISRDAGGSWTFVTEGLHAPYCRAVAVCEESVLVSASTGPRGREAAVYRGRLDGSGRFEKCGDGLPEWFGGNIDTFSLAADRKAAAFGTEGGDLYLSSDQGRTWHAASVRPAGSVHCVAFA